MSRTEPDLKAAKELFESAIALDPAYALAYSGLADAYMILEVHSSAIPPATAKRQARELVSKALEINPDLSEARASLGLLLSTEYDFSGAEKELRRATSLNPSYSNAHNWLGNVLAAQGRYQECLEEYILAELADPLSIVVIYNQLAWLLLYFGNKEQAADKLAKATQLYPDHRLTEQMNVLFLYHTGNYSRAIELSQKALDFDERPYEFEFGFLDMMLAAYSAIGNRDEIRKWLAKIEMLPEESPFRSGYIALAYAALGEVNEFLIWARRACDEKALNLGHLRLIDREIPTMRNIRQDPRFIELFRKVGLKA